MEYSEDDLTFEYKKKLRMKRLNYAINNAKFKVGDFIYNVTGIIKVDRVGFTMSFDKPVVIYYGKRYKKLHGKLLRTKDNNESSLMETTTKKI